MLGITSKLGDNFIIHWEPILVVFGVLLIMIISSVLQDRTIIKQFQQGKTDEKFIDKCQNRIRTCEKTPAGRRSTYRYRTMICAAYLSSGSVAEAFEQFNALRQQEYKSVRWLYLLFTQYFSSETYQKLSAAYMEKVQNGIDDEIAIQNLIRERVAVDEAFREKEMFFREQLKNDFVAGVLDDYIALAHKLPKTK